MRNFKKQQNKPKNPSPFYTLEKIIKLDKKNSTRMLKDGYLKYHIFATYYPKILD
jgi:hypothetical protein